MSARPLGTRSSRRRGEWGGVSRGSVRSSARLRADPEAAGGRGRRGWGAQPWARAGGRAGGRRRHRRRQGRQVPQEAALSGSFPPAAGSRTGAQTAPAGLASAGAQVANLSKKLLPSPVSHSPPAATSPSASSLHLSPSPAASTTVAETEEERGRRNLQHKQTAAKKKKKGKEIPSPETNSLNRRGKPTPEQATLQLQPRLRRAGGVPGLERRGGRGSGSPRTPERLPEGTKLPPTIPAGSSRVSQRRRCASRRLPSPGSLLLRARLLPSLLPELGSRSRSLGEKDVSARTIPFSPPPLAQPARSFSLALPRAPRLSRPAFPSQQPLRAPSVAIIHGSPGDRR